MPPTRVEIVAEQVFAHIVGRAFDVDTESAKAVYAAPEDGYNAAASQMLITIVETLFVVIVVVAQGFTIVSQNKDGETNAGEEPYVMLSTVTVCT